MLQQDASARCTLALFLEITALMVVGELVGFTMEGSYIKKRQSYYSHSD